MLTEAQINALSRLLELARVFKAASDETMDGFPEDFAAFAIREFGRGIAIWKERKVMRSDIGVLQDLLDDGKSKDVANLSPA